MAFPIKCGDCKKSFSISDEVYNRKVRGKQVTIKCKSCGAAIRVDGTKGSKPPEGGHSSPPARDATFSLVDETDVSALPTPGAPGPGTTSATGAGAPAASPATPEKKTGMTTSPAGGAGRGLISSPTKPATTRALESAAGTPQAAKTAGPGALKAPAAKAVASPIAAKSPLAKEPAPKLGGGSAPGGTSPIASKAQPAKEPAPKAPGSSPFAAKTAAVKDPISKAAGSSPIAAKSPFTKPGSSPTTSKGPIPKAAGSSPIAAKSPFTKPAATAAGTSRGPVAKPASSPNASRGPIAGASPLAAKTPNAPAVKPAFGSPPAAAKAVLSVEPEPESPFLEPETVSTPEPAAVAVSAGDDASDLTANAGLLWAVDYGESEHRELTTAEIADELAAGAIDGQTLVWHDNMPDWLAIRDVKELSAYVTAKREPDATELPKPPSTQQLVSGKTQGLPAAPRATLPFGPPSSQRAPSSSRPPLPPKKARVEPDDQEEVVTSARLIVDPPAAARPPAPSSPGFPNPLPAAGGATPAPSPPAFPPARASQPGPPALPATYVAQAHAVATFPATAPAAATGIVATALAAPPMAGPAPPMAAPAMAPAAPGALLAATSPASPLMAAPLAPSAPFAPAAAVAAPRVATADIEWPQARSKKPLIIGAIGLCAAVVVAWLLLSGSDEPSVPVPSNEATQQPPSTPEPPPPEPTPSPASPPPESAPAPVEKPDPPGSTPIAPPTRSQGTTKGGFADMFEQGAKGAR